MLKSVDIAILRSPSASILSLYDERMSEDERVAAQIVDAMISWYSDVLLEAADVAGIRASVREYQLHHIGRGRVTGGNMYKSIASSDVTAAIDPSDKELAFLLRIVKEPPLHKSVIAFSTSDGRDDALRQMGTAQLPVFTRKEGEVRLNKIPKVFGILLPANEGEEADRHQQNVSVAAEALKFPDILPLPAEPEQFGRFNF